MPPGFLPKRLYKYRAFNVNTLRMLTEAEVYYADPTAFNDPLDSKPSLQLDTDLPALEDLLCRMIIQVSGPERAQQALLKHRLMSRFGDHVVDSEAATYYTNALAADVLNLLREEVGQRGILSLAQRWNCPLMWSHYADEHRGLCIEYDMEDHAFDRIQPVDYRKPRGVKVSELIEWKVKRSDAAEQSIIATYFLAKAPQWRYEREWREVDECAGPKSAPARISAVYFGLRCDASVKTAIVKLHAQAEHPVKFYSVQVEDNGFRLKRALVDVGEIARAGLKSSAQLDLRDGFRSTPH